MLKRALLFLGFLNFFCAAFSQNIQSPEKFLGYKLGDQFTPHYKIIEYFQYIAQASKNVKLVQYGSTNEGRPLIAMFIASDENIGRLEEIRVNNLHLAGLGDGVVAVNSSRGSREKNATATSETATTKTLPSSAG